MTRATMHTEIESEEKKTYRHKAANHVMLKLNMNK
jgi:hypothetical protein